MAGMLEFPTGNFTIQPQIIAVGAGALWAVSMSRICRNNLAGFGTGMSRRRAAAIGKIPAT